MNGFYTSPCVVSMTPPLTLRQGFRVNGFFSCATEEFRLNYPHSLCRNIMNLAIQDYFIAIPEYLEGEQHSPIRHEYLAGRVYAMAGAGERHNLIAGNLFFHLRAAVRGTPCRAFISDMKVYVEQNDAFYYPDVMVTCDPQDTESLHKHSPCLIVEVLSPATETIDRREKLAAYRTLASLRYYLLVAQDRRRLEIHQCDDKGEWRLNVVENTGDIVIACGGITADFSMEDVYEDVRA